MSGYAIGEVCGILELKPHVLRYWERELPMLAPKKDNFGRRVYTEADLETLFRVRHLLHDRKLTVAGVRKRMWEEISGGRQNQRALLFAIRSELVRVSATSQKLRASLEALLIEADHNR